MQEYESTGELLVELGSDQTSLHNPFNGGYYPMQVSDITGIPTLRYKKASVSPGWLSVPWGFLKLGLCLSVRAFLGHRAVFFYTLSVRRIV